jgi:D-alanyl-lipoteichoic acid acyltransferase DltB (MBOAT superfamily)
VGLSTHKYPDRNIFILLLHFLNMAIGLVLLVICVLVIAIWLIFESKRMKHKIFAILLIGLVLFSYFSFVFVFKGKEIDYTSFDGIQDAATMYFSWLGTIFVNFKTITTKAINMDWSGNETG